MAYVDVREAYPDRTKTFAGWAGGFACACPRCRLARARPEVGAMEAEASGARSAAVAASNARRGSRAAAATAAAAAMPVTRRAALRAAAERLPPHGRAFLAPLCEVEASSAAARDDSAAAARLFAQLADLLSSALGLPPDDPRVTRAQTSAASACLAAGDADGAELRATAAVTGACAPPWGTLSPPQLAELAEHLVSGGGGACPEVRALLLAAAKRLGL